MSDHDPKKPSQDWLGEQDGQIVTEPDHKTKKPRRYKVLLLNDDYTTMEFVVMVLMNVFHHEHEAAVEVMLHVHHQGAGVAGIYPFEVAETKASKAEELARQQEFPLRCGLEPE